MARSGTVEDFDEARGTGTLVVADGWLIPFHCTAIADGTRTIVVGTEVVFVLVPGHGGRYEARGIWPFPPPPPVVEGPGPGGPASPPPSVGDPTGRGREPARDTGQDLGEELDPPTTVLRPVRPGEGAPVEGDEDPPTTVLPRADPTPPQGPPPT
jgi:cold shock CspA family protein